MTRMKCFHCGSRCLWDDTLTTIECPVCLLIMDILQPPRVRLQQGAFTISVLCNVSQKPMSQTLTSIVRMDPKTVDKMPVFQRQDTHAGDGLALGRDQRVAILH